MPHSATVQRNPENKERMGMMFIIETAAALFVVGWIGDFCRGWAMYGREEKARKAAIAAQHWQDYVTIHKPLGED